MEMCGLQSCMRESREYLVFCRLSVDLVSGGMGSRRKHSIQAAVARCPYDLLFLNQLTGQASDTAQI